MAERNDDPLTGTERPLGQSADAPELDETVVIRAEIVETRERMSDTLDEIGERLNPHVIREQVTERVKDGIRDATIGRVEHMARNAADSVTEARATMADTVRDNPIPATMVAVGLGWLLWNGRRSRTEQSARYGYGYGASGEYGRGSYAGGASAGYPYGSSNLYTGSGAYAGGQYGEQRYGEDEPGGLERAKERAGDLGESAKERAAEVAHSVTDRARDVGGAVVDRTRRGTRRVEDSFFENPLAMGAVTMALGVAAGLTVPQTDREVELMGGARDKLVDRMKDTAQETKEKVQHVASRAMEETKSAAREEGLTG